MFKYSTAAVARIVLDRGTLRWSTPRTFNDPFDVQFDLQIEVNRDEVRRLVIQKLWDDFYEPNPGPAGNEFGALIRLMRGGFPRFDRPKFEEVFGEVIDQGLANGFAALPRLQADTREHLRNSKILCLTTAPDNVHMWTHYAGQHTGAVLKFRNVEGLDSPWSEAKRVNYVNAVPSLADNETLADIISGRKSFDARQLIDSLVFTKSVAFSHEQEWRIYSGDGRNPEAAFEDCGFDPLELEAVILGPRISQDDRAAIVGLLQRSYPHAELHQATPDPARLAMRIDPA